MRNLSILYRHRPALILKMHRQFLLISHSAKPHLLHLQILLQPLSFIAKATSPPLMARQLTGLSDIRKNTKFSPSSTVKKRALIPALCSMISQTAFPFVVTLRMHWPRQEPYLTPSFSAWRHPVVCCHRMSAVLYLRLWFAE